MMTGRTDDGAAALQPQQRESDSTTEAVVAALPLDVGATVAVTGGAGFLGSRVVSRLLALGFAVVCIDDLSTGVETRSARTESARFTFVHADVRHRGAVVRALAASRPQAVIHLAALHFIPACTADPVKTLEINTVGTQLVLEACALLTDAPRFVFASTADVYAPTTTLLSESSPLGPTNVYGHSKLAAEGLVRLAAQQHGIEAVTCRLFNLYGPSETNPHVIPEIVSQLRVSDVVRLGNTKPKRDFVYVEDAADAIVTLCQGAPSGTTVNIGTGVSHSIEEVVDVIRTLTGRNILVESDDSRWRVSDRLNLQCDCRQLRKIVPEATPTSLTLGLQRLLREEGVLPPAG